MASPAERVDAFTGQNAHDNASNTRPEVLDVSTVLKLIIEDDEGKTTVYPLVEGEVSIGRKEGNTIRLLERNVSRRHARVLREKEEVYVEDLDSYNGVRINGERIGTRQQVREGDLIEIGDYHLALRQAAEDSADYNAVTQNISSEDTLSPEQTLQPDSNDTQDTTESGALWPPGTMPDFRLPDDLLSDAQLPQELASPAGGTPEPRLPPEAKTVPERPQKRARSNLYETPPPVPSEEGTGLPPFPVGALEKPADLPTPRPQRRSEAAIREPVEVEPTQRAVRPIQAISDAPRLICVSTQYAGQSYNIDRSELVIGRVEENDIVIEHRSVSRNHAKLIFDGRSHKIFDLQSANGILVNGEEYAMTNLRAGDLIELGNVRFRFVPAGERFDVSDEEAREIRANGFEAPSGGGGSDSPANYDLSAAATVTDTPKIPSVPQSPAVKPPVVESAVNGTSPRVPAFASKPDPDSAPAQTVSPRRMPSRVSVSDAIITDEETFQSQRPGMPYRRTMMALIAVLTVIVLVLLGVLFGRGDEAHDNALEDLYNQGRYSEVEAYFTEHEGEFARPAAAAALRDGALTKIEAHNFNGTGLVAPSLAEPSESEEPVRSTANELKPEPKAKTPPPPRTARAKAISPPDTRATRNRRATRLSKLGRDALTSGRLEIAERHLTECIKQAPSFALCHRSLGILYASKQDTLRSLKHYREYVELAPEADDADRVRKMIEAVEAGAGQ